MANFFRWQGTDLLLQVKVQPGSRCDEIMDVHNDVLKVRITAPPVDGKANKHLCRYIANICKVKKSQIHIESGHTNRNKTIRIQLDEQKLPDCLTIKAK